MTSVAQENLRNGHSLTSKNPDQQISIEVVLITAPEKDFVRPSLRKTTRSLQKSQPVVPPEISARELDEAGGIRLVSATSIVERHQPLFAETISESRRKQLVEEFQLAQTSNVMYAPKVTVFDEQVATVQDIVSRPFVIGVDQDKVATKPNPKASIVTIDEGTTFAMRSTIRSGNTVQLDLSMKLSNVRDVDTVSAGESEAVQVPTVHESRLSLAANISPGETLAVWGFETIQRVTVQTPAFGGVPLLSREICE